MKFKKIKERFEALVDNAEDTVNPEALKELRELLNEKKAQYTHKLRKGIDPAKRDAVEVKLEVIQAHLKKIKTLLAEEVK